MRIYNRGIIDKDLMFVVGKVVEIFFDIMYKIEVKEVSKVIEYYKIYKYILWVVVKLLGIYVVNF